MGKWLITFLASIVIISLCLAAPFDSGWREWRQPNGVKFTARYWGDEFLWWMKTSDGYRFIQGIDGYYYYAVLDENGEYAPSGESSPCFNHRF